MSDDLPSVIEYSEDVSTAEAPPALPAADYTAEVRGAQRKTSQAGNEYVEVMFHISPDQYPPDYDAEIAPDGVNIPYRRVPIGDNPTARYRMRMFCESIGVIPSRSIDINDFIGCQARVTTAIETNEGVERPVIAKVALAD